MTFNPTVPPSTQMKMREIAEYLRDNFINTQPNCLTPCTNLHNIGGVPSKTFIPFTDGGFRIDAYYRSGYLTASERAHIAALAETAPTDDEETQLSVLIYINHRDDPEPGLITVSLLVNYHERPSQIESVVNLKYMVENLASPEQIRERLQDAITN